MPRGDLHALPSPGIGSRRATADPPEDAPTTEPFVQLDTHASVASEFAALRDALAKRPD